MKLRTATPDSPTSYSMRVIAIALVVIFAVAVPIQLFSSRPASADEFDEKIAALQQRINSYQNEANALREQANTLQNTLNQLAVDKQAIQTQISLYQTQYDQLVADIKATEKRIETNRKDTGDLIVQSSLSSDVSLIVRLASSENLADYIDREANSTLVRDTIVEKTKESQQLKKDLVVKQSEVKKVLDEQTLKRNELAQKEAVQQKLLADTQGNEANYQNMINASRGEIEKLRQDQAARAAAAAAWAGGYISVGGTGGYPWAGVGYPCWSAGCVDPWGVYYRECVSYVAWRLNSAGKGVKGFGGYGHAYQWPATTQGQNPASGITAPYTQISYGSPKVGDAAVIPAGVQGIPWTGHIMYVEAVLADGSINISEYNFAGTGQYSERNISSSHYQSYVFISFPNR